MVLNSLRGQNESDGLDDAQLAPERVAASAARARLTPVAPERYALQLTIGQGTHDKLRHAQALLGHQIPSGELAEVLDRALDALIARLERRKLAATDRPDSRPRLHSANPRHVPAEVRREVWARDGGQCTFVSAAGHRCPSRTRLEFDHVDPVARGGRATVERMRLRCRAHNQYAAECAFGAGFMSMKREAAQDAAHEARAAAAEEVVPWLCALGLRLDEARRRAAVCEALPDAPLEERVRQALRCSGGPPRRCAARAPRPVP